jgi:antitoxin component YwqK of YwqJK toxin-antitoxin module
MRPSIVLFLIFFGTNVSFAHTFLINPSMVGNNNGGVKLYTKEYYENGNMKAEGWEIGEIKTGFWIFYHPNGTIESKGHYLENKKNGYWHFYNETGQELKEGHYTHGSAENWWIFYDIANAQTSKFQFKNNKKNGFCLRYKNRKLIKAEKYSNNKKEGEWTSIFAFKRDNPGVSLR